MIELSTVSKSDCDDEANCGVWMLRNRHTRDLISIQKTHTQQQGPQSPTVTLTWHTSNYKVHKLHSSSGCTTGAVYVPCISECTSGAVYGPCISGCTSGAVYTPCILGCTSGAVYVPCISECTSGAVYVPCISECTSGAVYVPCISGCTCTLYFGMYFWWSLCTLYLLACQVRVTLGDSGLCCVCVASAER